MNWFALRICRHCKQSVGMDDKACKHCKKQLMSPDKYKLVLFAMIAIIIVVYGSLFFLYLSVQQAYHASCPKPTFYQRASAESCDALCTNSCANKGKDAGTGLLLTTSYTQDTTTLSCECTCSACA